jgi:DNA modification methylase
MDTDTIYCGDCAEVMRRYVPDNSVDLIYADPQPVTFNAAVAEAVKQGLIDSRTKSLNEHKYFIRFTKRKKPKG